MRFTIRKGPQAFVVFLSSGIPQCQLNGLAVYSAIGNVILEYGGDIALGDTLDGDIGRFGWRSQGYLPSGSSPR